MSVFEECETFKELGIDKGKNSGDCLGRKGNYSIRSYANLPCDHKVLANNITFQVKLTKTCANVK